MKKTAAIFALLCLLFLGAACAKELPDPTPEVEQFYKESIKNIESDFAQNMLNKSSLRDLAEGSPELEESLKNFIAIFLEDIEYSIIDDEPVIDQEEKTAVVVVAISCVDLTRLDEQTRALVIEKSNEIMATGRGATQEELNEYYLETASQMIIDGGFQRISGYQEVELLYNETLERWEVTNGDALISELSIKDKE